VYRYLYPGQRINFKQATNQQSDMITDLQHEVASLKRRFDEAAGAAWGGVARPTTPGDLGPASQGGASPESEVAAEEDYEGDLDLGWTPERQRVPESTGSASRSIFWVDDHPENNAVLADSWRRDGTHVAIARSTSEALDLLAGQSYGLVISDVGRRESGLDRPGHAVRALRELRPGEPGRPHPGGQARRRDACHGLDVRAGGLREPVGRAHQGVGHSPMDGLVMARWPADASRPYFRVAASAQATSTG
jgi:CheY-like chemotaxis protein